MSTAFNLPDLGENIESADVTNVLVAVGDTVAADQPVLEVEAGKAAMEIPVSSGGTVSAVHVQPGDTIGVGSPVLELESSGAKAEPAEAPATPEPVNEPAVVEERAPVTDEGTGVSNPQPEPTPTPAPDTDRTAVRAAPNVRRLARELGVDIHDVVPAATGERISAEEVKIHARRLILDRDRLSGAKVRPSVEHARPLPDFNAHGPVRREKMSQIRKTTMEHLTQAWVTIPHVTQHDMADISKLEELRKRFSPKAEAAGTKLTVTAILVKVVAAALKVYPKFNSSIDPTTEEILFKEYYNIGVAVDTEKGLLVPVIRGADQKNMVEIAQDLGEIAQKARTGKTALADLQGGTFTITNLGGIGGSFFTPIINAPEVAILGVGRAIMDPCIGKGDGMCSPRLRMPLSLSYDHRIIDGADGARFLRWIVEAIEEPMLISLEG